MNIFQQHIIPKDLNQSWNSLYCIRLSPHSSSQRWVTHCSGLCLAFQTDVKHLQKAMRKCVISAEGLAPSHHGLWVSQRYTTHSVTLLCLWGLMEFWVPGGMRLLQLLRQSSDTGKRSGEKLNPAASCIQWVKWWSIHSGQDAAAPQFNPCSQAIRTTAIPQWSLLLAGCSWWYCSLGNDYLPIKANVCFISVLCGQKFWDDIVLQLGRPFTLWVLNLNRPYKKCLH